MSAVVLTINDTSARGQLGALLRLHREGFKQERMRVGEYMVKTVVDRLNSQRLVDGSPMPKSRAAAKRGGKTLLDRGHLQDSYIYKLVDSGVEAIGGTGAAQAYAAIHHGGGMAGRKRTSRIIARPVLGINTSDEGEIGRIFLSGIQGALNRGAA